MQVITGYEQRNRFIRPIIRAVLSRLLGWQYDGSNAARRRLVTQLPLIAFRRAAHQGPPLVLSGSLPPGAVLRPAMKAPASPRGNGLSSPPRKRGSRVDG
jgi:hypothetical protein